MLFTALTLLIGQPFYEAISKKVEDRLGGVPAARSMCRSGARSPHASARTCACCCGRRPFGVLLFAIGLIPVVGQVTAAVLGALVGRLGARAGVDQRAVRAAGLRLRDRRRMLRERRAHGDGFGMATFVCFLIPLGAVLVMPAAVAGATLLSRRLFGLPE